MAVNVVRYSLDVQVSPEFFECLNFEANEQFGKRIGTLGKEEAISALSGTICWVDFSDKKIFASVVSNGRTTADSTHDGYDAFFGALHYELNSQQNRNKPLVIESVEKYAFWGIKKLKTPRLLGSLCFQ
jgi:hypothetical protein